MIQKNVKDTEVSSKNVLYKILKQMVLKQEHMVQKKIIQKEESVQIKKKQQIFYNLENIKIILEKVVISKYRFKSVRKIVKVTLKLKIF